MNVSISTRKVEARAFSIEIEVILPKCKVYNFMLTPLFTSDSSLANYWK